MTVAFIILGLVFLILLDTITSRSRRSPEITPNSTVQLRHHSNEIAQHSHHVKIRHVAHKPTQRTPSASAGVDPVRPLYPDAEKGNSFRKVDQEIANSLGRKTLTPEHLALSEAIKKRNIDRVLHFTQHQNLSSILRDGLVSRDIVDTGYIDATVNDPKRLDRHTDTTSLSIQHPNSPMLYKLQKTNPNVVWAVLEYSPSILWRYDCAFYKHNAAKRCMSTLCIDDLMDKQAFESMFPSERCNNAKSLAGYPEDIQAEVLAREKIPHDEIVAVHFNNEHALNIFKIDHPGTPAFLSPKYFSYRN